MTVSHDDLSPKGSEEGPIAIDRSFCIMSSKAAAERILGVILPLGEIFNPENCHHRLGEQTLRCHA